MSNFEKHLQSQKMKEQEREKKLNQIVSKYHKKIEEQLEKTKQTQKVEIMVKRAINNEWVDMFKKNAKRQREIHEQQTSSIMSRYEDKDKQNSEHRKQKQKLIEISLMQNFLR